MGNLLRKRYDNYLRARANPVRFDEAYYAALYVESLEAHMHTLEAALVGMVALMDRSDGVAYISDGPNGQETGSIHWGWHEEAQAVVGIVAALAAVDRLNERAGDDT